jgi:hypothetical protein
MHLQNHLIQMDFLGQVVHMTRCQGVPGFPALLAAALSSQGCPWYPEYFVYEEYRDYDQGQFICQVCVLTPEGIRFSMLPTVLG